MPKKGLIKMLSEALKATGDAIAGDYCSGEEKKKRLDICLAPCEFLGTAFDETSIEFNYCKVCNCPLKSKTALRQVHCPMEFW